MIEWKQIPGFSGEYFASNTGEIKDSLKIKKQSLSSNKKYYRVTVTRNGESKQYTVHRLIAWAFLGRQDDGIEVRHKDGNGLHNNIENICYGTKSDNMKDAINHGTFSMSEWHPRSTLSNNQIKDIILSPLNYLEIADKYSIHPKYVHSLRRGVTRKHDSKEYIELQPKRKILTKFDLLTNEQLAILSNFKIKQREAGKLIGVPQRTIWLWRKKFNQ